MNKDYSIKTLPKVYRRDTWVNEIYQSCDIPRVPQQIQDNYDNIFFSTLTPSGCENYEHDLSLAPASTLEERRYNIRRAWLWRKKCSLEWLNDVVRTYSDEFSMEYDGDATLYFITNKYNYFEDTELVNKALTDLEIIKPAHMLIKQKHKHITWGHYYNPVTWATVKTGRWLRTNEIVWRTINGAFYKKTWQDLSSMKWSAVLTIGE